jgi:phosphoribosylaminoimidazole-succinocarboxamide synthase
MTSALTSTDLPFPKHSGKVRDCYDLGETLLVVSTDRISAFDYVLEPGIPDKGKILTQLSRFWFQRLQVPHHYLGTDLPDEVRSMPNADRLAGRSMLVRKARVIPFECVVRGYLEGSGWREYQTSNSVCGVALPKDLQQCSKLSEPIFTPATKVEDGHDENVSFDRMVNDIGIDVATKLRDLTLDVYRQATNYAESQGIIIADTKFEFGWCDGQIILIDEVLTPDSSRFWWRSSYEPGRAQASMDKQFVREYLMNSDWDRNSPPPKLPESIVSATRDRYMQAFKSLTGQQAV